MFNNLNATFKKLVVILLIITLTYANIVLIGNNIIQGLFSYALEAGEENLVISNQELLINKVCEINGELKRVIQVAVETGIEAKESPIKNTTLTLNTNIIEGTLEEVKVTELNKNSYTNGTWELVEGKLKITLVNANETLETKEQGLDKLLVTYIFQKDENGIETIKQPLEKVEVTTYANEALTNEVASANFEDINTENKLVELNILNKDIHINTISEEGTVEYTESLNLDLLFRKEGCNIIVEDESNNFYNKDEQENEEVTLAYKTTTLNKENLLDLLGNEGKLVITDTTTDKEVVELTKEHIEAQKLDVKTEQKFTEEETEAEETRAYVTVTNKTVEIEYETEVTKIRFEIINVKEQTEGKIEFANFAIENTKLISNITNKENLDYLQEKIKFVVEDETEIIEKIFQSTIKFKNTITKANFTLDNAQWVVGQANTVKYTITLDTTSDKSELFVNPMFLLELPSSVESVNTANSEFIINNNNGAFTNKRVFVTTLLERKFVVIILEGKQTSETIQNGDITIDLTLELNITENATEGNETTKLYYQNDTVTSYESGKSFDTAEVTASLIMASEPKDEIGEKTEPGTSPEENNDILLMLDDSIDDVLKQGNEFSYTIFVTNNSEEEQQNLKINDVLPEGITFIKVVEVIDLTEIELDENRDYSYNEETRLLTINVDKIDAKKEETMIIEEEVQYAYIIEGNRRFKITARANELEDGIYSKEIKNIVKIQKEENILAEKEIVSTISDAYLELETEELPEELNENEDITLGLKITNKGLITARDVIFNVSIPEEISPRMYNVYLLSETGEEEYTSEGTLSNETEINLTEIPAQKIYYIQLLGTINDTEETKQITIEGTVNGEEISWTTEARNIPDDPENPVNPDDPENPVNPDDPENPVNPDDPENPVNPDDPENPVNPDNPGKFDLSLNQYLNKITVTNSQGTTTYNYKDTNFAKVEIHSKQMNGSKVTLEYRIVIKNEGTIPGYARKIVDYMPKDLIFNAELNKDWFVGDDGNIYSVALIEKILNPGETAELTLILEKQMTNENTGTVTNLVEIYEASNNEKVEDINSIPGDKLEGQNDMSKVEVIIATSTGTIILYTTLAIAVVAITGFGFYRVKKVTLDKKGGC